MTIRGVLRHACVFAIIAGPAGVPVLSARQAPSIDQPAQTPQASPPAQAAPKPLPRPAYQPNAANEDWSVLKDPARRTDFWDPVKYIPIGDTRFITLSGEIRYRPEGFRIKGTDAAPSVRDNYLLHRYIFGVNVRLGRAVGVFTEVQSGIINGKLGPTRPTDKNTVDLHQGFVEFNAARRVGRLGVRVGRQELTIGSSRLISASPSLNTKRSFDGLRVSAGKGGWAFEGAAAVLTALKPGVFDDDPLEDVRFWGMAAARPSRWTRGTLGFYYLGTDTRDLAFVQGRGRDLRHTFGLAWRGAGQQFDFNYDLIYQVGDFADASVRAWGASTETGYRFTGTPWKPRLSVRVNSASGDRDAADPSLQSFNPLFPGASYAGMMGIFGPTNMTDLTPAIAVVPRNGLLLGFERPLYWRTSTGDGLYATNLSVLAPAAAGTGHFVGATAGIFVIWQATPHLQLSGAIMRLVSGGFLEATRVGNGAGLYSVTTAYRF